MSNVKTEIILDESRDARQQEMVAAWVAGKDKPARGTLVAPTGFGKSRLAEIAISRMQSKNPAAEIVIIVPRGVLKDQWEAKQIPNTKVYTIQYLLVNSDELYAIECDLLVIDEIHRFAADEFSRCFDIKVRKDYILGLTATFERLDGKEELVKMEVPVIYEQDYQEAVNRGWIEPVREVNLQVDMTMAEQLEYDRTHKWFKQLHGFFKGDFNLAMACLKGGPEVATVAHDESVDTQTVRKNAMNWFKTMNKRKTLLYESGSKLKVALELAKALKDKKKIYFGVSAGFAADIADKVPGAVEYHSNVKSRDVQVIKEKIYKTDAGVRKAKDKFEGATVETNDDGTWTLKYPKTERWGPTKIKEHAIDALKEGKITTISSAKALEEGLDIQDLEYAIITSRYKSVIPYKQIRGRIGRKITEGELADKKPVMINLVHPGTADENWLAQAQVNSKGVKTFTSVEELLQEINDPNVVSFEDLIK